MINFAWDFYQQRQIGELKTDQLSDSREHSAAIQRLEDRLDRLALINTAMWELIVARLGLTQQEIANQITEVDLRDGVLDGRIRPNDAPLKCSQCGRTLMQRHRTCLYCGQNHQPDTSAAV
ncbi:hypothetical protein PHYC_01483 [Phycisphaerales bacterium]|nr:hypothetical protein PHYC_01483 [Phycisphaerales bacterium]